MLAGGREVVQAQAALLRAHECNKNPRATDPLESSPIEMLTVVHDICACLLIICSKAVA
jgi:hypothetical protein